MINFRNAFISLIRLESAKQCQPQSKTCRWTGPGHNQTTVKRSGLTRGMNEVVGFKLFTKSHYGINTANAEWNGIPNRWCRIAESTTTIVINTNRWMLKLKLISFASSVISMTFELKQFSQRWRLLPMNCLVGKDSNFKTNTRSNRKPMKTS